ncbi:MAG TPA: ATP-binding protein [Kofleriaceae bacterium]|nr:ATP-binding protein [Kofleriaceae bacterium]
MAATDAAPEPYRDPADHLRDELRRVWLRVEYEIRLMWARRGAARPEDAVEAMPVVGPETVGDLFSAAAAEWSGTAKGDTRDAEKVLDKWLAHHRLVEARTAATFAGPAGSIPPLLRLRALFDLTDRQWASLAFALGPEVDPDLVTAYRYLARDATCRGLDGRLLAHLVYDTPDARSLLARDLGPGSPLVQYRLVELQATSESLLFRRIRPAPRLVQLADGGEVTLDPELTELAEWRSGRVDGMFPSAILRTAAAALRSPDVIVAVQGQRGVGKRLLLQLAAGQAGRGILLIDGRRLMREGPQSGVIKAIVRELVILGAVPVFADVDDIGTTDLERDELAPCITALLGEWDGPLAITVNRERMPRITQRPLVHIPLEVPPLDVRTSLWSVVVPSLPYAEAANLAGRFAIPGGVIVSAAQAAGAGRLAKEGPPDVAALEHSVAGQLHQRLQRMGKKLETPHDLEDLVVDDDVREALIEIQAAVRQRRRVRAEWGLRGAHGISVLFSGHPGTGKTMAGTVLARRLGLDIYEVDLSQVVSKWLGETEKNLSDVFDAAEPGHVVLLFNEADSLFGKRTSDVKSSNDRYANLETNYLLQRLERFGGLAILTTNLTAAIDQAFKRRFTYDVFFSFPSPEMRAELWRRTLPERARGDDIGFEELAERYELSGGFIKVACERAAYMAGAAGQRISDELMRHTIERMYRERGKLSSVGPLD